MHSFQGRSSFHTRLSARDRGDPEGGRRDGEPGLGANRDRHGTAREGTAKEARLLPPSPWKQLLSPIHQEPSPVGLKLTPADHNPEQPVPSKLPPASLGGTLGRPASAPSPHSRGEARVLCSLRISLWGGSPDTRTGSCQGRVHHDPCVSTGPCWRTVCPLSLTSPHRRHKPGWMWQPLCELTAGTHSSRRGTGPFAWQHCKQQLSAGGSQGTCTVLAHSQYPAYS